MNLSVEWGVYIYKERMLEIRYQQIKLWKVFDSISGNHFEWIFRVNVLFYLLFSSLTTICHLLLKRQPHLPDVVHCFINFSYKGLQKGWVPKPDWNPNEILNRNLSIQLQHKNPLSYSPQVLINFLLAIGIFPWRIFHTKCRYTLGKYAKLCYSHCNFQG